jgi:ATP-dependent DNA helicase RecG
MNEETILNFIKKGESETVEFKSTLDQAAIETIAAFANTKGGYVFIGVADSGKIVGVQLGNETIPQWLNQIKTNTFPTLIPDVTTAAIDHKNVVIFMVGEFPIKPVAVRGKYFKRVENSNHQLSPSEISNLHLQSLQLSWDSYPAHDATLDDLDVIKIERFISRVNAAGRFVLGGSWQESLEKLDLIRENKPANAAKLLFAKELKQYSIHVGRFKTPSMIIDDKMIKNTLYEAVEETMRFIISHLKVAFEFTGEIQRTEIFEYSLPALRELVLNAIVHRDYTSPVDVQIKIFDPGKLYGDVTIEKLKTDTYQSRARNKLVAEAFYLTKDIEKYGSGYIRVREEIKSYPTMRFDYEESGDGYLVTLGYSQQKTVTTPKATPKATPKTTSKTRDRLLELITENNQITREELSEQLGIGINGVKQQILKLKKEGILERVGDNRTGFWKTRGEIGGRLPGGKTGTTP